MSVEIVSKDVCNIVVAEVDALLVKCCVIGCIVGNVVISLKYCGVVSDPKHSGVSTIKE